MKRSTQTNGMSRRDFIRLTGGALGAAALPSLLGTSAPASQEARKLNILYVVLDEWGYYEMSGVGNPHLETPNIDRLMKEGLRFTQMLAGGPVCAPTRCALMTGLHAGHMTVRANGGADPLRADDVTIAGVLKKAGYATGGFGKWGLGGRGTSGVPEKHGFDVFFGYYDQVHAHSYFPRYLLRNSEEVPLEGNTGDFYQGRKFSQSLIYEQARQFIRDNKDRPFFCYCPWTPPHGAWGIDPDEPSWQKFKDKPWTAGQGKPTDARVYAAMVHMDDRQIGGLLDLLAELKIADRTLVIVTGDNGGVDYFARDLPSGETHPRGFFAPNVDPRTGKAFRGQKGNLYEGGLRVPAVAYWPGRIKAGSVSDHLCCFPDVLPTLAELSGAKAPGGIDGISILPTLLGQGGQRQHEYLYWEYGQQVAVRIGQLKGIRPKAGAPWELYDLSTDIEEKRDIASDRPDVVARMKSLAEQAHQPVRPGEILDRELMTKDHTINLGGPRKGNPQTQPETRGVAFTGAADARTRRETYR